MSTQRRNELNQFHQDRDSANSLPPATRAGSVAQSIVGSTDPVVAAPRADGADRGRSWLFVASLLVVIVLATCAAAAVAALYGPVFTQPLNGP